MNQLFINADDWAMSTLQESTAVDVSQELHAETAEDVSRYVVVEINKNMYGISTDTTVELMDSSSTQITRVSHAPRYVQGVINHRGSIIPAIDSRSLLGFKSHKEGVQELEDMLAQREEDHVQWLLALKACVDTGEPFTKATDPNKCAFGKWYNNIRGNEALLDSMTKGSSAARAIVDQFDGPHKTIHSIATRVIELAQSGHRDEAKQIIDDAWENELSKMRSLFKQLIETLRPIHTSMMIITEYGSQKIGLIVDAVHSVFDCPDSSIDVLPDSTDNSEFLKGLVHQSDGSYILIADIEHIYKQTAPE